MTDVAHGEIRFGSMQPWSRDFMRIVSWNIERGLQFSTIREFLRTLGADLLLLQEVDLNARRTHYRDVASELAHALNLNYVFGAEFQELSEGTRARPAYHGMATLSPWPLSKPRIIHFRDQSTFWKPRWYVPDLPVFQRRIGGRIALVAEVTIYGTKLVTYNLHLESRGGDEFRFRQLNEVLADCRRQVDQPGLVVAGDFNLNAGAGFAGRTLGDAGLHDAVRLPGHPTSIAHGLSNHARAIDWIFVSDTADSQGRVHNDIRASDHYPVSATLARPRAFSW
jgi:endonuclease/exonuclease/phosphatase family metal-dependent hydrolase